jgi:hypothetical protein
MLYHVSAIKGFKNLFLAKFSKNSLISFTENTVVFEKNDVAKLTISIANENNIKKCTE